jgi:hypothetical protein
MASRGGDLASGRVHTLRYRWEPRDARSLRRLALIRSRRLHVTLAVCVASIVLGLTVSAAFLLVTIFCVSALMAMTVRSLWPSGPDPETPPTTVEIGDDSLRFTRTTGSGTKGELVVQRADIERISEHRRIVLVRPRDESIPAIVIPRVALTQAPGALAALRRLADQPAD